MTIYKPYTYLIGWSDQQKFYYGVRFAKNCNPSDLWVKYFTSSEPVAEFRKEYGEPDIIQIRKTFNSKESAILWEQKVLIKINARYNPLFLNQACLKEHWCLNGGVPWNKGKTGIYSEECRQKISNARIGKPTTKGRPNPLSSNNGKVGAAKQSAAVTGRRMATRSDGTRYWVYPE